MLEYIIRICGICSIVSIVSIHTCYGFVVSTPHFGDYTTNDAGLVDNGHYVVDGLILGSFIFNDRAGSIRLGSSGHILGNIVISPTGISQIPITLQSSSRVEGVIKNTKDVSVAILGEHNDIFLGGIDFIGRENKFINLGLSQSSNIEVGIIPTTNYSIQSVASTVINLKGATLAGGILLGNDSNVITMNNTVLENHIMVGNGINDITMRGSGLREGIFLGQGQNTVTMTTSSIENGGITTQVGGTNTITGTIGMIDGDIVSHGTDTISLRGMEVRGNIVSSGVVHVSVLNNSTVTGSLVGGRRSNYTITNSVLQGNVEFNGIGNLHVNNSTIPGLITQSQDANTTIVLNNSTLQSFILNTPTAMNAVTLGNNSVINGIVSLQGVTAFTMQNSIIQGTLLTGINNDTIIVEGSELRELVVGSGVNNITINTSNMEIMNITGENTINITDSRINNFLGNGLSNTMNVVNSTLASFTIQNANIARITNSVIDTIIVSGGTNSMILTNSNIKTINMNGINNIVFERMTIPMLVGNIGSDNTISVENGVLEVFDVRNNRNTLTLNNSTLDRLLSNRGQTIDMLIEGTSILTKEDYTLGNGVLTVIGTLEILKDPISINKETIIQAERLVVGVDGQINIMEQGGMLKLDIQEINNNTTKPLFRLYTNLVTGESTKLDISGVGVYTGSGNWIEIIPSLPLESGKPLDIIEGIIVSNPVIVPVLNIEQSVLGGYTYELQESVTMPNVYDLVQVGTSPTNYGFLGSYSGIQELNASIWRGILSHFQEELQMVRNRSGEKRIGSRMIGGRRDFEVQKTEFSIWAKGSYSNIKQKVKEAPHLENSMLNILAGVDLSSIAIGESTTLLMQFFTGFGSIEGKFSNVKENYIHLGINQQAISFGGTIGIESLSAENRGKFFVNTSIWFSMISNILESNVLPKADKWNNESIQASFSLGYSIYGSRMIFTPQIDIYYTNILKKKYISPNATVIDFSQSQFLMGRASVLFGVSIIHGVVPYIRGGITIPMINGNKKGEVSINKEDFDNPYKTQGYTADATVGIAYRGDFSKFKFSFSAEVSGVFGAKEGVEGSIQMGFAF